MMKLALDIAKHVRDTCSLSKKHANKETNMYDSYERETKSIM